MKQLYFSLVLIAMMATTTQALAADDYYYGITINDVEITARNESNVLYDAGCSVKYDKAQQRLTLTNAHIQYIGSIDRYGEYTELGNLEINLVGENTIEADTYFAIELTKNTDLLITGSGSLRIETQSTKYPAIWCHQLTLQETNVNLNVAGYYTLGGDYGNDIALVVNKSYLTLTAGKAGVVQLNRFELQDAEIVTPQGVTWDSCSEAFNVNNTLIPAGTTVEIRPLGAGAEGVEDVQRDDVQCTKVFHDGHIYILRADKAYTLQGTRLR